MAYNLHFTSHDYTVSAHFGLFLLHLEDHFRRKPCRFLLNENPTTLLLAKGSNPQPPMQMLASIESNAIITNTLQLAL